MGTLATRQELQVFLETTVTIATTESSAPRKIKNVLLTQVDQTECVDVFTPTAFQKR
jgi:hypothetical protein